MTRESEQAFEDLSVPEQIRLVQDLWDRIASNNPDGIEPTESQKRELERRLRAHEENPGIYESWEELRRRLIEASQ
jgi:putative addiction module component (TIGR02574 family)